MFSYGFIHLCLYSIKLATYLFQISFFLSVKLALELIAVVLNNWIIQKHLLKSVPIFPTFYLVSHECSGMPLKVEFFEGFVLTFIFLISFGFLALRGETEKCYLCFCNLLMSSIVYKCLAFIAPHELAGKNAS